MEEKTTNYNELSFDLRIICGGLPGRGNALKRLFSHCGGITQQAIADELKIDRSTVSLWINEKRWPSPRTLVDLLCFLSIDRAELATATAILIGSESSQLVSNASLSLNTKAVTSEQLLEILREQDPDTQKEVIFNSYETKVLLCLAKKAAGERVSQHFSAKDTKVFFDELRLFRQQRRARKSNTRRLSPDPKFRIGEEKEQLIAAKKESEAHEDRQKWLAQSVMRPAVEDEGEQ